jgi:hypothetical protein
MKDSLHYAAMTQGRITINHLIDFEQQQALKEIVARKALGYERPRNDTQRKLPSVPDSPPPQPKVQTKALRLGTLSSQTRIAAMQPPKTEDCESEAEYELDSSFEREYMRSSAYEQAERMFVNKRDYEGNTALHIASKRGNMAALKALLRANASMFLRNGQGQVLSLADN